MNHFTPFTAQDVEQYIPQRYDLNLESDLEREDLSPIFAEKIEICSNPKLWEEINADYVLVGIPEDLGVRANMGRAGAATAWKEFLGVFLRLPHTYLNDATRFCILGEVYTLDIMHDCEDLDPSVHAHRRKLSDAVMLIDKRVSEVVYKIKETGKTPIFIGGGHNNCYPILRTFGYSNPIDCINIDAHTDLRVTKGRHSGNGFSHAIEQGFLGNYFMIGIQENYLNKHLIEYIQSTENIDYSLFAQHIKDEVLHVERALKHVNNSNYGLEIDLDVVANFPSSAQSPIGFTLAELILVIKQILDQASDFPKYFHFCEAAPEYGYHNQVGKALAAIISDLP